MRKKGIGAGDNKPAIPRKRKRFSWDDVELTLLSLPTIAFCYVPMFGIVFAFKNYKYKPGKGFLYSMFVSSKSSCVTSTVWTMCMSFPPILARPTARPWRLP